MRIGTLYQGSDSGGARSPYSTRMQINRELFSKILNFDVRARVTRQGHPWKIIQILGLAKLSPCAITRGPFAWQKLLRIICHQSQV